MNVRSAGKRLFRRLGLRRGFQPDWRDARFLASLSSRYDLFREFRRRHSTLPNLQATALFFRERETPRFFVNPSEISQLVSRVEVEHPSWKEGTLVRVRRECEEGLDIYAGRGPKLDRTFPWGRLERGTRRRQALPKAASPFCLRSAARSRFLVR